MAFGKLVWTLSLDGQKDVAGTTNEPNLTDKKECVWYIISWCVRNAIYFVHELKATPVKPEESHHDKPLPLPAGSGGCVICKRRTKYCCWGCTSTLGGVIPVCPQSERPECNVELHNMRNQIWISECIIAIVQQKKKLKSEVLTFYSEVLSHSNIKFEKIYFLAPYIPHCPARHRRRHINLYRRVELLIYSNIFRRYICGFT